ADVNCDDGLESTVDSCVNPGECGAVCVHIAAADCVDRPALINYVSQWKRGSISMSFLLNRVAAWKAGC
ncbi:MAG: hypothetical protein JW744_02290, partial [Candidatus Diapherotrites archaeon]|nr:hypothetical protein [Candidatus Diapherotrites archaeon]